MENGQRKYRNTPEVVIFNFFSLGNSLMLVKKIEILSVISVLQNSGDHAAFLWLLGDFLSNAEPRGRSCDTQYIIAADSWCIMRVVLGTCDFIKKNYQATCDFMKMAAGHVQREMASRNGKWPLIRLAGYKYGLQPLSTECRVLSRSKYYHEGLGN